MKCWLQQTLICDTILCWDKTVSRLIDYFKKSLRNPKYFLKDIISKGFEIETWNHAKDISYLIWVFDPIISLKVIAMLSWLEQLRDLPGSAYNTDNKLIYNCDQLRDTSSGIFQLNKIPINQIINTFLTYSQENQNNST